MRPFFIHEPELQFGQGRHLDIRFGISNYKPLDYRDALAPKAIALGIIGTERNICDLRGWLDLCAQGVEAKVSNQPNLFPRFPGFGADTPFDAKLVFDSRALSVRYPRGNSRNPWTLRITINSSQT
jgi:hypothetical protein